MLDPVYLLTIITPFVLYYLYMRWTYKGPPHVTGLPLVGYAPFLGTEPYRKLHELVDQHGPIFSFYMGALYTVVLGNYELVYEAFVEKGHVFNSRPPYLLIKVYDNETGFALTDGEDWKVTRNFTMNTLKTLGFGKNFTKDFVQMEIQDLISELKSHNGKPVEVGKPLSKSMSTLIAALFTGKRYHRNDNNSWMVQVTTTAAALVLSYAYDYTATFPWLRNASFVNQLDFRKTTRTLKDKLWSLIEEEMGSLRATYSGASEPENFIHSWYSEQEKRSKNADHQKNLFSDFSLKNNLDLLIQASTDTTSVTLHWAFLYLVLHQEVQEKIHQEIDKYIGHSREPMLEDAKDMHYIRAFLMEVHRRGTVAPWGVFHSNKVKSYIRGFEIPKDSVIICNFWSLHHDPKYFPDPYRFAPERFLDENGKFQPKDFVNPFSFGRRQCPGRQVAEMQLFLYLASILQVFELRAAPDSNPSDRESVFGQIRRPVWDALVFTVRHIH